MNPMPDPKSKTRRFLISLILLTALVLILSIALLVVALSRSRVPATGSETKETFLPVEEAPKEKNDEPAEDPIETPEPEPEQPLVGGLLFTKNGDGTCRLSGLGNCIDACVVIPETSPEGDLVTEIDADAFRGASGVAAVQIPSTVQYIGERAFADCNNLLYISVSPQNRFYCDAGGVLYSKDQSVLLQYPTLAAAGSLKIPITVKAIREMAFYNCPYLTKIYYPGSPDEWEKISVGAKNYALLSASKQFYSERGGK